MVKPETVDESTARRMNRNISSLAGVVAWLVVAAIVYATLTNIGFMYRLYFNLSSHLFRADATTYGHIEHIVAYATLGSLLTLAYPRRLVLVCCFVFGGAALLEYMQTLTPDRHGTVFDALEKMAAGAIGIAVTWTILRLRAARRSTA